MKALNDVLLLALLVLITLSACVERRSAAGRAGGGWATGGVVGGLDEARYSPGGPGRWEAYNACLHEIVNSKGDKREEFDRCMAARGYTR